jgi:hypothetical protein
VRNSGLILEGFVLDVLGCAAVLLAIGMLLIAGCDGSQSSSAGFTHFDPNSRAFWSNEANWTTDLGPAYADITLAPSNFLPCRGGPYALCYYSGPGSGSQDLSCTLSADGHYANCLCYDIPYGVYYVDINAILNHQVYEDTVAQCGADGSLCATINSAPVCQQVNQGTLIPGSALYSTFSFECVPTDGLGVTDCGQAQYAGCMTAPCAKTEQDGIVKCSCPVFDGPYQIGQNEQACTLGSDLVWSAAYAPPVGQTDPFSIAVPEHRVAPAVPSSGTCLPDAPGASGCPLYVSGTTVIPPNAGVDCAKVCDEYDSCRGKGATQAGYTCDATLCTDQCSDRDLVGKACAGLSGCDISEIVKTETAADCSCCASQLCGCSPNVKTDTLIAALNQQHRDRGITPQCDVNGTLCGAP